MNDAKNEENQFNPKKEILINNMGSITSDSFKSIIIVGLIFNRAVVGMKTCRRKRANSLLEHS